MTAVIKKLNVPLLSLMALHCGASLLHFAHNAMYLHDYPNLPSSLTAFGVWVTWFAIAALGICGYWLFVAKSEIIGLIVIGAYAVLGFGGLDHYVIAPVSAHTMMMNASILFEVITAGVLLIFVVWRGLQLWMVRSKR